MPRSQAGGTATVVSPKVSVAIVTYNHGDFLAETLDSVVSQETPFPFEVIVGDDASTDDTTEILQEYATRYPDLIRPMLHGQNVGNARNIDAVVRASRGEYIAHLDGDDLMLPGKLAAQAALLDADPEMALCFHNMRVFDSETGATLSVFTPATAPLVRDLEGIVRHGTVYCHSAKMYRRSSLPTDPVDRRTRRVIDWLMHIQSASTGKIGYINEIYGAYRRHARAVTVATSVRAVDESIADQLYSLERAATLGASASAIRAGRRRVLFRESLRYLEIGDWEAFQTTIGDSWSNGYFSAGQAALYGLRRAPRLAQRVQRLYRKLS